jgi:diguanylate cyclase (GGDEF)-like protein/PAS domain S-box-containing protein
VPRSPVEDAGAPRTDRLDRLERVIRTQAQLVGADLDLERFMHLVVEDLRSLTRASGAVIELADGDDLVCRCASGEPARAAGSRRPRADTFSGLCLETAAALRCDDATTDPRIGRDARRRAGARSMICAPLFNRGAAVGVLKVMSPEPGAFDDTDLRMLGLLAGALGAALGKQAALEARARVEARLRASEERVRAMLEHAHDAVVSMDARGRVTQWNRAAERLFGWSPIEAMGQPVADLVVPPGQRRAFEAACAGFLASENVEDVHQRAAVSAIDRSGRPLAIEVSISATRIDGLWEMTAFAHDVSERRRLEDKLREMALSDGLTGLANRRAFMEALEKAVSRAARLGHGMALLFMDLDRFKAINDRFGHQSGDHALQEFARRLSGCVRKGDTVARLGGDEFTVLAEGVETLEDADSIARKIVEAMEAPFAETGVALRTSIGISLYRAPADASQFLRDADRAMYMAKHRRRGGRAAGESREAMLEGH